MKTEHRALFVEVVNGWIVEVDRHTHPVEHSDNPISFMEMQRAAVDNNVKREYVARDFDEACAIAKRFIEEGDES